MKKYLSHLLLFTLLGFCITIFVFDNNVFQSISDTDKIEKTVKDKFTSERKKRMKGEYSPDQPDMFAKLYNEIRTGAGETRPGYKPNYKFDEYNKAVSRSPLRKSDRNITWAERGPGNVGGRTRGLVVDFADLTKQTWFAAAVSGGVWKTTNAGESWTEKTFTLPNLATTCIVQSHSNPDILYIGTGEGFYNSDAIAGDGIFKSTDHGETWEQLSSTAGNSDFRYINRMLVDPNDENTIVICANGGGIQKSVDGGESWTQPFDPAGRVQQIIANPNSFDTLYAAVNGVGVYKSVNAGNSWFSSSTGLNVSGRIEIAVSKSNPDYLYASIDNTESDLYMSNNAGLNWKRCELNTPNPLNWLGQQGWYDNTIAVHPYNEKIVYLGGIDLYKATITNEDSSPAVYQGQKLTHWYLIANYLPYVHADQHNITMIETGTNEYRLLVGNDGGVFYSDDEGSSWTEVNNGYNTTQFYGCDKKHGAEEFFGGMQDNGSWQSPVGQTASASTSYAEKLGGDGYLGNYKFDDGNQIIGAIYYDALYKTSDGGINWIEATEGLLDAGNAAPFVTVLAKTNSDPELVFTTGESGVWRSDNFADDWTLSKMDDYWGYSGLQTPVEISLADPQIVWAGARMSNSEKIQVSTDGGVSFSSTTNTFSIGNVTNIVSHPSDKNTAFAVFSVSGKSKILRTTNLGQSWTDITGFTGGLSNNGFPNVATFDMIVMPYDTNVYWAFTEIGIFESVDAGQSWAYLNEDGFPAVAVWRADIVDDMVVMATHGRGIWTAQIPQLASHEPRQVAAFSPVLQSLGQTGENLVIPVKFRSVYDSTNIFVNSEKAFTIGANEIEQKTYNYPLTDASEYIVNMISYKDGIEYKSAVRSISVMQLDTPRSFYSTDFSGSGSDFILDGFTIGEAGGIADAALHSPHPYNDQTEYSAVLKSPIIISDNALSFRYKDIAIVEPGQDGIEDHEAFGFWDYVVVEGSIDGVNWLPLGGGYDCRANAQWLAAYNNSSPIDESYYVQQEINLKDYFNTGDEVIIRFRLVSDQAEHGWGWAIDDIELQAFVGVDDEETVPVEYSLNQNYPNPFNPSTTIEFALPVKEKVTLKIYNAVGEEVTTLINKEVNAGNHKISWNASGLSSGVYFYRLKTGNFAQTKKLMLLK